MSTSNGRQFVYMVVGADGCECTSVEGIFDRVSAAYAAIESLRQNAIDDPGGYFFYGKPELLEVETVELNKLKNSGAASPPVAGTPAKEK